MSYNKWPKRSAEKNYFMVPNEIFGIGLDFREISLYTYLLRCENRDTYQCYPSYKTIGKAVGMSENTVRKYIRQLEETHGVLTAIQEHFKQLGQQELPARVDWPQVLRFQGYTLQYGIDSARFEIEWYTRLLSELEEQP